MDCAMNEDAISDEKPIEVATVQSVDVSSQDDQAIPEISTGEKPDFDRIGFVSRPYFASSGYRKGLVQLGFGLLDEWDAHTVIVGGGIIERKVVQAEFEEHFRAALEEERDSHRRSKKKKPLTKEKVAEVKAEAWSDIVDKWAEKIASVIPELTGGKKKPKKIFVITSSYYDGEIGKDIATRLTELRGDIQYWGENERIFPLKRTGKTILVRCAHKAPWRGKYYSTPVTREVEDSIKVTSIEIPGSDYPDLYVIGCVGSSMYKPQGGEARRPYISLPDLHKIRDVGTSENQIGVVMVEVRADGTILPRTFNLKDATTHERDSIRIPSECGPDEQRIVELVKQRGGVTIGMASTFLQISKTRAKEAFDAILDHFKNRMVLDKASGRLDFAPKYLREELRHNFPAKEKLATETIATFGCLHAGHPRLARNFFLNRFPEIILQENVTVVAALGDLIVGLYHRLMLRDEVYGGMNYTRQEKHAAWLFSRFILKVFRARFVAVMDTAVENANAAKKEPREYISQEELRNFVSKALLLVKIKIGNHDDWPKNEGVDPLEKFYDRLVDLVTHSIRNLIWTRYRLYFEIGLRQMVREHLQICNRFTLPETGLNVHMFHPSLARTDTVTIRLQKCMNMVSARDCQAVLVANFHVGVSVNEWKPGLGQQVGHQAGTVLSGTQFEDSKLKDVDTHIGLVRLWALKKPDGPSRVYASEVAYFAAPPENPLDNNDILATLESESPVLEEEADTKIT